MPNVPVTLRLLQGDAGEIAELQHVLEAAPRYAQLLTGSPPGPAEAQSVYSVLPEGKSYEDKYVYGIYAKNQMVGCIDIIRHYPDEMTAHLGLLLLRESNHHQGIGTAAYRLLESQVEAWQDCQRLRLNVVGVNLLVAKFWRSVGFAETGETKKYVYRSVVSELIIMEKMLGTAEAQRK